MFTPGASSSIATPVSIANGGTGQSSAAAALTALWPQATTYGTLATMQGLTGVAGQAFFNTTYNSWFDWIVDRWYPRYPDPRYGFMHQEKFMGATVAASYPSVTIRQERVTLRIRRAQRDATANWSSNVLRQRRLRTSGRT